MKKLIIICIIFSCATTIPAQQGQPVFASNPYPRTITVNGSAEMEVIPDEIYVNVELREYQKKGDAKKDIEIIKTEFLKACKEAGIPDSSISIAAYNGVNAYYWFRKKKIDPNLNASITYQVKFKNSDLMDLLVDKLDDDATQNFLITAVSHSKITEFRRQLKIQAVKAAREKGIYLAEAIGEKMGEAITINEPGDVRYTSTNPIDNKNVILRGMSNSNEKYSYDQNLSPKIQEVNFKKMKLRFEVQVIFSLK
jgi:uncharacterized protein YggE